ncbi:hypothetical protein ACQY74_002832 [Rhizobium leguminosarum bv. trifolii]
MINPSSRSGRRDHDGTIRPLVTATSRFGSEGKLMRCQVRLKADSLMRYSTSPKIGP